MAGAGQQVGEKQPFRHSFARDQDRARPAAYARRRHLGFQSHFRGHAERHDENDLAEFHNPPVRVKKACLRLHEHL